jgi:hypothetical protein
LAKEQIEKIMKKIAKNPDTYKITEVETACKRDSIYYYSAYRAATYDGSCSYNGVVKELTKNKQVLETVNEFGL